MLKRQHVFPCFLLVALLACPLAFAQSDDSADDSDRAASVEASAEEIAALVEQLDSDKFAERQAASEKLEEIGQPAIEALTEAACGDSLEVTTRSLDLLKGMLESSDTATKEAAKAALEEIAKCDRPSAARRAQDALKPAEPGPAQANNIFGGEIQLNVIGGGARKVSVRTVNGVKTIEAEEGDRKVKIVDDPAQGIKMEVTTKKNGKETTEKYEAKNAEELKKKHAAAYEIYEKYANQGGNIAVQMQIGGGGIQIPIQPRIAPAVIPRRVNALDSAARMLPAWASHLKRMASDDAIKQASKESKENLKEQVAKVQKQLAELQERLEDDGDEGEEEADEEAESE